MKHRSFAAGFACILALGLGLSCASARPPAPFSAPGSYAKGADVGWLPQMEATGYVFRDDSGEPRDCLSILKDHGINSIRLRVWVNPSGDRVNGHCSPDEVAALAKRAADAGFRLMIDFHYSDSWADPGKQVKPSAWAAHGFQQLVEDVYAHTFSVLSALKAEGVTPEWVQVGNEINPGMLLPDGSTSDFGKLARLINSGYDAVKAVNAGTKVIVHLASGADNATCRRFFDGLTAAGGKWDVIGMSYYPYWIGGDYSASMSALGANLDDMAARYGCDVMVVEVGGDFTAVQNTYDTVRAAMDMVGTVKGGRGLGVFYWEPEGAKSWSGYQLSAWGDDGRPTAALDAFLAAPMSRVTADTASGATVAIYSYDRSAYLTVDSANADRLAAALRRPQGSAEEFTLIRNADASVSFRSRANGMYVSAANSSDALAADAPAIGPNQKFLLAERADGGQAILSAAIGTHWNSETDGTIRSEWNDAGGGWQKFMVAVIGE